MTSFLTVSRLRQDRKYTYMTKISKKRKEKETKQKLAVLIYLKTSNCLHTSDGQTAALIGATPGDSLSRNEQDRQTCRQAPRQTDGSDLSCPARACRNTIWQLHARLARDGPEIRELKLKLKNKKKKEKEEKENFVLFSALKHLFYSLRV